MSQTLCNWRPSLLLPPSWSASRASQPEPLLLSRPTGCRNRSCRTVRAAAANGRDNLDHLQRASGGQPQQPPKRRFGPVAPVVLWDRFPTARTVQQMMETMDRMMEEPFACSGGWPTPLPTEEVGSPEKNPVGDQGMRARIQHEVRCAQDDQGGREGVVEEKMLVIKAEKAAKKTVGGRENKEGGAVEEEGEGEWSGKSYRRYISRIALPEKVQFEKINAEVKDGVLYITIPKDDNTGRY